MAFAPAFAAAPKRDCNRGQAPADCRDALARSEDRPAAADPFSALGARSPFCRRAALRPRAGCRVAGSIAHTYPISHYGLDIQVETRIDKVENNLFAAIQSVGALVWLGLVYALKGVLLLLEWAFSLDLLNEAMSSIRRALERLHQSVLGTAWFLAALAIAGLWGIWNGLVQQRTIDTATGLLMTVVLMVAGLVVIRDPAGTVGEASRLANQASLGFLSAASTGSLERPERSFADSSQRLFDALVLRPWCALEFGDVRWCIQRRPEGFRNADLWLAFPADGKQREGLYQLTKGEDPDGGGIFDSVTDAFGGALPGGLGPALQTLRTLDQAGRGGELPDDVKQLVDEDPARVAMQEKEATFTRVALLALIALGLLGAICLLLYLAVKLVLAGLLALMLLLLAPVVLLAPAFGEAGREAFVSWAKRLVGALVAKLVYALLLALVVVCAGALAALPVGWFGTWLLQLAFWWGILIKRHELTDVLSIGDREGGQRGRSGLLRGYQEARAAKAVAAGGVAAAAALPLLAHRHLSAGRHDRREAGARAIALASRSELDRGAVHARKTELAEAAPLLERRRELQRSRSALDRKLAGYEAHSAETGALGREPRAPTHEEAAMLAARTQVDRELDSDEQRHALALQRETDRSRAREGAVLGEAERAAWRERRGREIVAGLAPGDPRNLRAANIDPRDHTSADPPRRTELERHSAEAIERDRKLLAALPREDRRAPLPKDLQQAELVLDRDALRARRSEERTAWRHERLLRRRRQHLYRR